MHLFALIPLVGYPFSSVLISCDKFQSCICVLIRFAACFYYNTLLSIFRLFFANLSEVVAQSHRQQKSRSVVGFSFVFFIV